MRAEWRLLPPNPTFSYIEHRCVIRMALVRLWVHDSAFCGDSRGEAVFPAAWIGSAI
jgi:hypothetical protein